MTDSDTLIRQFIGGDRQLVAIAVAHLDGDTERVDVLARDHLADHPDSLLVAWVAGRSRHRKGAPS